VVEYQDGFGADGLLQKIDDFGVEFRLDLWLVFPIFEFGVEGFEREAFDVF